MSRALCVCVCVCVCVYVYVGGGGEGGRGRCVTNTTGYVIILHVAHVRMVKSCCPREPSS